MGRSLSMDIRSRAHAAVDVGSSRRAAARRFGVSVLPVIRWDACRRVIGSFGPKAQNAGNHAAVTTGIQQDIGSIVALERVVAAETLQGVMALEAGNAVCIARPRR